MPSIYICPEYKHGKPSGRNAGLQQLMPPGRRLRAVALLPQLMLPLHLMLRRPASEAVAPRRVRNVVRL